MGLLPEEDREACVRHIQTCPHCAKHYREYGLTDRILAARSEIQVPTDLEKQCLSGYSCHADPRRGPVSFHRRLAPVFQVPAFKWTFVMLIFVCGIGAGLFLRDGGFSQREASTIGMLRTPETLKESRTVRNYLISVEALFLNLDNMEGPETFAGAEWEVEVKFARAMLEKTSDIKAMARNDEELLKLVNEIEYILKNMLNRIELKLNDMPRYLARDIRNHKLIPRIHEYISYIS